MELGLRISRGFRGANDLDCDAQRGDGQRFVVRADEKLTAFAFRRFPCRLLRLPKRIGLRSNIRLSGVLVEMSWITLPDVSTHLRSD
jgi:hypothetical protein